MKKIEINLPETALEKIRFIIEENALFENEEDFMVHAITDLLEEYADKN